MCSNAFVLFYLLPFFDLEYKNVHKREDYKPKKKPKKKLLLISLCNAFLVKDSLVILSCSLDTTWLVRGFMIIKLYNYKALAYIGSSHSLDEWPGWAI